MSHRVVIIDQYRAIFTDTEVRDHLTPAQCTKVDQILACPEWTDEQFRYLSRRAAQVYCQDD